VASWPSNRQRIVFRLSYKHSWCLPCLAGEHVVHTTNIGGGKQLGVWIKNLYTITWTVERRCTTLVRKSSEGPCGGPRQDAVCILPEYRIVWRVVRMSLPSHRSAFHRNYAMMSSAALDTSAGRQLSTRVSNACERCRRNKT
jgi:hypothetical protein